MYNDKDSECNALKKRCAELERDIEQYRGMQVGVGTASFFFQLPRFLSLTDAPPPPPPIR